MKYSFSERVKDEYFTVIKPEKFPVGYTATAIDLSRETHQIPPFDFISANGNYPQIWQEVKRIIGDLSTTEPILIFCNAFERDQTTYLLNWLATKGESNQENSSKPVFRVCSFEALVAALLRRLDLGNYAHQSVREQLRRPVYTLQVKQRCLYHDSLAIQYCCRAINHGFSLFLDGFIRERFLQSISQPISNEIIDDIKSISNESIQTAIDSISSTFIANQTKTVKLATIGCHVFIQSTAEHENQSKTMDCDTNKSVKYASTINSNASNSSLCVNSIGRGRRIHPITTVPTLSHAMH